MDLFTFSRPIEELLLRALIIYIGVNIVVRVMPKRTLGGNSPIDLIALITLGALVADSMSTGSETPLDFLLLAATIAALDWTFNWLEYRSRFFARVMAERRRPVVRDGVIDRRAMRRELITEEELPYAMRRAGIDEVRDVSLATVEATGDITVIGARPGHAAPPGHPLHGKT